MTKRETSAPERPPPPSQATRSPHVIATGNVAKVYSAKRKVEEENGVETEENGVRPKVNSLLFYPRDATRGQSFFFHFLL